MANHQKPEEGNTIENLNEHLTTTAHRVQENKKVIMWVVGAVVCVGLFFCAWLYFFHLPRIQKSFEEYAKVETTTMGNDTTAAAGYAKVADNQSGDAANLAAFEAGVHYYNIGKYQEALNYLKKFSTSDEVLKANATILIGDCYVNLKKYDDAVKEFRKAANDCNLNPQIGPRALLKEATVYEAQKKYDKALEVYELIQKDYPQFDMEGGLGIDGLVERAKARLGK